MSPHLLPEKHIASSFDGSTSYRSETTNNFEGTALSPPSRWIRTAADDPPVTLRGRLKGDNPVPPKPDTPAIPWSGGRSTDAHRDLRP